VANAQMVSDELEELEPNKTISVQAPVVETTQLLEKEHTFSSYYLPSSTSFNQDGEGQNYSTENGTGQGVLLGNSTDLNEFKNQLDITLMYQKAQFIEPDDIGGEDIQTSRFLLNTTYDWKYKSGNNGLAIGAGATLQMETAETFSNGNKLLTNNLAIGPSVFAKYSYQVFEKFSMGLQSLITVPLYLQEYGKKSGYYKNGYHVLAGLLLNYSVSKTLALSLGLLSENQQRSFEGDGDRGVTDAKTSFASFSVPLGVVYDY
jgi:hypothetical protein